MTHSYSLILLCVSVCLSVVIIFRCPYHNIMSYTAPKDPYININTYDHAHVHDSHTFLPPSSTDSRSPCPALNILANHGYLPRNGRNISTTNLVQALENVYGLTHTFAYSITLGGLALLKQFGSISLADLARHDHIEHDASLVHRDAISTQEYAPTHVDGELLSALLQDASCYNGKLYVDVHCLAAARVRREADSAALGHVLDNIHKIVASGEAALVLNVFGDEFYRIPVDLIANWREERLPSDWIPKRKSSFLGTLILSNEINLSMKLIQNEQTHMILPNTSSYSLSPGNKTYHLKNSYYTT